MNTLELTSQDLQSQIQALQTGQITSVELTKAYLDQIKKLNPRYNIFVRVEEEFALQNAQASDQRRKSGQTLSQLDGIPYNLKDVYATKGLPTSACSHILEGWIPPYDATVYHKLNQTGAVLLGKTNTDEFTMGVSTESSYYGVTKNPWDPTRVPGGSSGGPAASIAARLSAFSIATDTGGSIRQPAAFCNVTGLRPTYGRVSRFGELAMASSLDQTGPIAVSAMDTALILSQIAGLDELDATSSPSQVENWAESMQAVVKQAKAGDKSLKGVKVGLAKEYFGEGVDPRAEKLVRAAIETLKSQGAELVELSLPLIPKALAAYYIICPAEVSSNMARYDGVRYGYSVERQAAANQKHSLYDIYAKSREQGFGAEVKRRIMLGTHVLSAGYFDAYYKKAEALRQAVSAQFSEAFQQVDVLAAPVSPAFAFVIGSKIDDPLAMYMEDILTVPLNIGGIPGISLPCGTIQESNSHLPVGLQIMADKFREDRIFKVSAAFQTVTDWHLQQPNLSLTKDE